MSESVQADYADRVRAVAARFPYPPTPSLSAMRRPEPAPGRRARTPALAWAVIAALVVLGSLVAVPQARAGLLNLIRVGAVRLSLSEPTVTLAATPPPPRSALDQLEGETTLENARAQASFAVLLPTYPPDLGTPDRVFLQDQGGTVVILAWMDPDGSKIRLLLQQLDSESWGVTKTGLEEFVPASVGGRPAAWTSGPYVLIYHGGVAIAQRIVEGHSLVWEVGGVTYRIEASLSLEEAVRIAESLE